MDLNNNRYTLPGNRMTFISSSNNSQIYNTNKTSPKRKKASGDSDLKSMALSLGKNINTLTELSNTKKPTAKNSAALLKMKGAVAGLGLQTGASQISSGLDGLSKSKGEGKFKAGMEVLSGTGNILESSGDITEIGGKVITKITQGGSRLASNAKFLKFASNVSKLGVVAKAAGAFGGVLSGSVDGVKGSFDTVSGIRNYAESKNQDEKNKATDKVVGGVLDQISGALAINSGICAATGVGLPAAVALGAASLGVTGVKYIYNNSETLQNGAHELASEVEKGAKFVYNGAKKIGNAVYDEVKDVGNSVYNGAKELKDSVYNNAKELKDSVYNEAKELLGF